MFHAPTFENKQQTHPARNQLTAERDQGLSPQVAVIPGYAWSGGASSGLESASLHSPWGQLARLQSAYGNQAVLRLLSHSAPVIQTKLAVNQPGDQFEQEADRVADQVMRMTAVPTVQRTCSSCKDEDQLQRKCAECEEEEKKTELQREETTDGPQFAPHSVHDVLSSPGQPLDTTTRAFMEPRFGRDFGPVRVHTDQRAAQSARAVGAAAYTVGKNIVFGSGRYAPGTTPGQSLIAHELAHTIQQASAGTDTGALAIIPPSHPTERDANDAARAVVLGGRSQLESPSRVISSLARQPDDGGAGTGADAGPADASLPGGVSTLPSGEVPALAPERKCGPDITSALSTVLGTVGPYFSGLSSWQKRRSCAALDIDAPFLLVNPIMAWDTTELFLPNTDWLDSYFRLRGCGSPRDPGCDTDPMRHLCETAGSCGNSVIVGGKCMLAGTANYALYGKMFKLCNDEFSPDYPRWDMRAMITLWKTLDGDDPGPPLAMATAVFDGGFPTIPAGAENRGSCTGGCGVTRVGSFHFIWEPYRPR